MEERASAGVTRWRKKPVVVDGVRWTGDQRAVCDFMEGAWSLAFIGAGNVLSFYAAKAGGRVYVRLNDWVMREPDGSGFYPCSAEDHAATYEPAAPEAAPSPANAAAAALHGAARAVRARAGRARAGRRP